MRLFTSFLATVAVLAMAPMAFAGPTYTYSASTSDSSPLSAVTVGASIIIDITLTTDDAGYGIAGALTNYDNTIVGLDAAGSTLAANIWNQVCIPGPTCFGGIANQVGSSITFQENNTGPGGVAEAEFFGGLSVTPAGGTGSQDPGLSGVADGGPQFQIVFDVIGDPSSSTTFDIGTFGPTDVYTDSAFTGNNASVTNATVTITVPEPTAVATSLAAVSSVFGVIAIRRRLL